MGLSSLEISPGRRASFSPKARPFSRSSGAVCTKDIFLSAAFNIGKNAGVNITQQEAIIYRDKRKPFPEEGGSTKPDQALLAEDVLSGERSAKVKKAFPNIFPPRH